MSEQRAPSSDARPARLAVGLLSAAESLGWIGRECGIFRRLGLDLEVGPIEVAGPRTVAGLKEGDWEFAEVGAAPVVEAAIGGADTVILLAPERRAALYLLGRAGIDAPERLAGGRIGVLTTAGQTGLSAELMLNRLGLAGTCAIEPLGTYPKVFAALAAGEIEAGVLTADYLFCGRGAFGATVLGDIGAELAFQGPIVATTRRLIAADRAMVATLVRGFVAAIHFFKTRPAETIDILQPYLGIAERAVAAEIHAFYAPRFHALPRAWPEGLARLIEEYARRAPDARRFLPADVVDESFLDEIERDGTLAELYGAAA